MKRRLTPKTVDALPPAVSKRYEVHDQLLPGLHLRVSATGGMVFYVSKRINGHMKRIKIGAWPILTLHEARDKARSLLCSIELGRYVENAPHEKEQRMSSTQVHHGLRAPIDPAGTSIPYRRTQAHAFVSQNPSGCSTCGYTLCLQDPTVDGVSGKFW